MIIAPLVFSTLVAGIAHMGDVAALGRVGVRSLGWFILASLVSLTLGLILVTSLHPGVGPQPADPAGDGRKRRRDRRLQPQGFRHAPRPASIFEAMSDQRDPADRRLLDLLRGRADRRRREAASRSSAGSKSLVDGDAPGHRLCDALRAVRGVHRGRQRACRARAADHRDARQVRRQLLPRPDHPVGAADRRLLS